MWKVHAEEPKSQKFLANVGIAKFYKDTIFTTKNSVVGKLRRITGLAADIQDKNTVHRNYTEKLIAIWHEAVGFPEDIVFKTDSGFSFNLVPADFEAKLARRLRRSNDISMDSIAI